MVRRRILWSTLAVLIVLTSAIGFVIIQNLDHAGPGLYVKETNESSFKGETIAFEDLNTGQQEVFERAITSSEVTDIPPGIDSQVFTRYDGVRYQNKTYETGVFVE